MTDQANQTLGQRIDAVLEPLYAEAEQHREMIAQATQKQQALQQAIDTATQGLTEIESRMTQVLRSLAEQEPVLAAVISGDSSAQTVYPAASLTPDAPDAAPEAEPVVDAAPTDDPAPTDDAAQADEPAPADEPEVIAEPVAQAPATDQGQAGATEAGSAADIALDPAPAPEVVAEAAAMPDASAQGAAAGQAAEQAQPDYAATQSPVDEQATPPADTAAAAERAATAAKQLRDKAAATR